MASSTHTGEPASLDAVMVILEEISKSNKALIEENKKLKDHLTKSDQNNAKALQDITSKLQNSSTPSPVRKRRRRAAKEEMYNLNAGLVHVLFLQYVHYLYRIY